MVGDGVKVLAQSVLDKPFDMVCLLIGGVILRFPWSWWSYGENPAGVNKLCSQVAVLELLLKGDVRLQKVGFDFRLIEEWDSRVRPHLAAVVRPQLSVRRGKERLSVNVNIVNTACDARSDIDLKFRAVFGI